MANLRTWKLSSRAAKRFMQGHPWVFSNELTASPKGVEVGEPIRLEDEGGQFLAYGYGNPHSLIAFRVVSRKESERDFFSSQAFLEKITAAYEYRQALGRTKFSHRLVFSEADLLPGVIIDLYIGEHAQAFSCEILTGGMEKLLFPRLVEVLQAFVENVQKKSWAETAVVIHRDGSFREKEGLQKEPVIVAKEVTGVEATAFPMLVPSLKGSVAFHVDLVGGQKTGFFLDQVHNIHLLLQKLNSASLPKRTIRVLDLCCYLGHWSSQIANQLSDFSVELNLVDDSQKALSSAAANLAGYDNVKIVSHKMNVLKDLGELADGSFDIVICDPPAFVKNKKDLENAKRAYVKLNTEAMRKARPGGFYVSCSCSSLILEEDFVQILKLAERKSGGPAIRWFSRGGQAEDHPMSPLFPEGTYLKAWLGIISP